MEYLVVTCVCYADVLRLCRTVDTEDLHRLERSGVSRCGITVGISAAEGPRTEDSGRHSGLRQQPRGGWPPIRRTATATEPSRELRTGQQQMRVRARHFWAGDPTSSTRRVALPWGASRACLVRGPFLRRTRSLPGRGAGAPRQAREFRCRRSADAIGSFAACAAWRAYSDRALNVIYHAPATRPLPSSARLRPAPGSVAGRGQQAPLPLALWSALP